MFVNLPNSITILRILLVPFTIWLMISGAFGWAFLAFIVAGISDGVDGYLARQYNLKTELGAYLDPLADKALLVSIFVMLGILHIVPAWLVILVTTRDVLIVGALVLSWVLSRPMAVKPLFVSKANTTMQIMFVGGVLAMLASDRHYGNVLGGGIAAVTLLTVASGAMYMRDWMRHMASKDSA